MPEPSPDRSLSSRFYWKYRHFLQWLSRPVLHRHLLDPVVGREYGISQSQKRSLLRSIHRNLTSITSGTGVSEHILLASRLLSLPRELKGDVIECGCFKGSSTATLSLACRLVGRRLIVCDSFEGLPEPEQHDQIHVSLHHGRYERYARGEYRGALEEVRSNVERFGDIGVCSFVKGYFEDTLGSVQGPFAMGFLDVDLHDSLRSCLTHLWPKFSDGGYLYTHEAQQLDYVARFFDGPWWKSVLGQSAPGLVGAGCGLPFGLGGGSGLGYTIKIADPSRAAELLGLQLFQGDPTLKSK